MLDWGLVPILWLQQHFSPELDLFFKVFTWFGNEGFYLLFLPLVYWCIDRRHGARVALLALFSVYVNAVAKSLAHQPRPFQYDPAVKKIVDAKGGGFPSGHTQGTVVIWGYLMHHFRSPCIWCAGAVMLMFVPLSRIYLGVHFPTDLLGGYVIGAVLLLIWFRLEPPVEAWLIRRGFGYQLGAAIIGPLCLILIFVARETYILGPAGTLMGLGVGMALERKWLGFEAEGTPIHKVIRFAAGAALLIALHAGLKDVVSLMGPAPLPRFGRYLIIGLWISFVSPWIFLKLGLAKKGINWNEGRGVVQEAR